MIFEHATLSITPGREEEFEAAFAEAPAIFAEGGARSATIRRSIEAPSTYLLVVEWETLEAHTVDFREGPLFPRWRALVSDFFSAPPSVEHFAPR